MPIPSQDTIGTATVGIVMPRRAGVSSANVNATAVANVGSPTITSSARFLITKIRRSGTPSASACRTR
ncbi:Uncharacterised protein [Mycobacterium tuberculosis]|nr:Uncharacterised protein [Mycobacterium tuberculosis]